MEIMSSHLTNLMSKDKIGPRLLGKTINVYLTDGNHDPTDNLLLHMAAESVIRPFHSNRLMMVKCKRQRGGFDPSDTSPLEVDVIDTRHVHDSEEHDHEWRTQLVPETVDTGGANKKMSPNQVPRLVDFAVELIRYHGLPTPSLQAISAFKEKVNLMDEPERVMRYYLKSLATHRVVEESGGTGEP